MGDAPRIGSPFERFQARRIAMAESNIDRLTVLGAGVLGGQVGWHSAFKGKHVVIYDPFAEALARAEAAHRHYAQIYKGQLGAGDADLEATRSRLGYSASLQAAVKDADLVIECVPEVPAVKTRVYQDMAALLAPHTLVATNSSTLLPSDFAAATGRPEKFCALHFANLIWLMNVAEIMAHAATSDDTLTHVTGFAIEIGMLPIPVRKEQNGYVLNSWFVPLLNAAQTLVTNGVCTPEDVDRTYLKCNPGASLGPMGMIDMVGMQTAFNVIQYWGVRNNDEQMLRNAAYVKERFIDRGLLGLPTGQGYYRYPNPAFQDKGFLAIPDASRVPELVALARHGR
jgi:3-hydroxyacyl-CoA dehydrogenase